ncbi:hypothetical protein VIGAN_09125000 [Vigna angularis var. angularis]|uniref:Uncharacterized protein n=1 Tax=Vigna angularis var. angularis TaxID=157739 RepID=A0A0S3SY53_PHAAN|nr:hypothetical protein VIGAN_09125000 [Vigna angularis var. angularis]
MENSETHLDQKLRHNGFGRRQHHHGPASRKGVVSRKKITPTVERCRKKKRSSTRSRREWEKEDFGLERVVCTVKRECWLAIGGVHASKKWQKEESSPAATSRSSREKRKNMELGRGKTHSTPLVQRFKVNLVKEVKKDRNGIRKDIKKCKRRSRNHRSAAVYR